MMIVEGAISVKAVIQNKKREVTRVFISKDKKTKDFNYIRKLCKLNNIPLLELANEELNTYLTGRSHGGVGAEVGSRINDEFEDGDIFYLDGIEDPFNLGYSLRTLYALGIKNVILNNRDYSSMEVQMLKSSAGAYEMMNVMVAKDEYELLKKYKDSGYYMYALYRGDDSKDIFDVSFNDKSLFMLGGEKRGISSTLLSLCDEYLFISYGSDFRNSLNACAALDVVATLLYKQRRKS